MLNPLQNEKYRLFKLIQSDAGCAFLKRGHVKVFGVYDSTDEVYTYEFSAEDKGHSTLSLKFNPVINTWQLYIKRATGYFDDRDRTDWYHKVWKESKLYDEFTNYKHLEIELMLTNRYRLEKYKCALVRPGRIAKKDDPVELPDNRQFVSTMVTSSYEIIHDPELIHVEDYTDNRRFVDLVEEL
jgi:hypothetical protein